MEPESTESSSTETPVPAPPLLADYQRSKLGMCPQASYDDVWYCYRLLLNREADPEGFAAFGAGIQQGISVEALVGLFLASPEFAHHLTNPKVAAPRPVRLNNFDFLMPEPQTPVERHVIATGTYKPYLMGALSSVLAAGQFVLDIGAGVGEFTILAASKVGPRGRVVALEPLAANMRLLLANCRANGMENIDILPFAASDVDGYLTVIRRGAILTSRDLDDDDLVSGTSGDVAYARTIDSVIPADQRVDVVRIALDGFDYRAALGAEHMLRRCQPRLFADWAPGLLHEFSGTDPDEYLRLLARCGYNRFTAMTRDHGAIDLGDDVDKLRQLPAKLGAANVEFYAEAV